MTGTIHRLWSPGLMKKSEEEDWRCQHKHKKARDRCHCFSGPSQCSSIDKVTMDSLWNPSSSGEGHNGSIGEVTMVPPWNPSSSDEELRRRRLAMAPQAQSGTLCEKIEKVTPDNTVPHRNSESSSFVALLRTCAKNKDLSQGTRLHDEILKKGLIGKCSDALVTMYVKCGALAKAKELLGTYKARNVFAWTALISAYARQGQGQDALDCFEQMQCEGISPDAVTFASVLKACGSLCAAEKGEQIHDEIARQGLLRNDIVLGNALVDMYVKCGALAKAQCVFEELPSRDVVSWNALIAGYAQHDESEQALNCFGKMRREGLSPDMVTFACILKACGNIGALDKGEQIHNEVARQGLLGNNIVLGTALVDMYAKCGSLAKARQVLEELPSRDVVSWSALITGYAEQDQAEQALNCFEQMQREGLSPDAVTFSCILKACGNIGAVDKGEQIHDKIARQGLLGNDLVLGNALVDMYVKCGALAKAQQVLDELPSRDVVSWNALIVGYAQQGQGEQALNCFKQMQHEGISPNAMTYACILNVCSHLGLVEDGHMCFVDMSTKYGIKPDLKHYNCMVDLFGRAGHLDKAVRVIQEMSPDVVCLAGCVVSEMGRCKCWSAIWGALLGACRKWGDVNVGRWAFEQALQVDKSDAAPYVLMANIYVGAGMQEDAKFIEAMRIENKAWRKQGHGWWLDLSGNVYSFVVQNTKHAQSKFNYMNLSHRVSQEGYPLMSPHISDFAHKNLLYSHVKELALACALINTPQGDYAHVVENMCICGDCQISTPLISGIEKKKVVF